MSAIRPTGKRHARATRANDNRLTAFVTSLDTAKTSDELSIYMTREASQLARVIKNCGGRQLEVQLQDGTTLKARVSGTLGVHGRVANKTHMGYVMFPGDVILITGGMAAAKVPKGIYHHLQAQMDRLGVVTPKGFFVIGDSKDEEKTDDGWSWDISAEVAKAEGVMTRVRAAAAATAEDEVDIDAI
jgi:translation initiation factor IF-1